jgi:hypothetical protein
MLYSKQIKVLTIGTHLELLGCPTIIFNKEFAHIEAHIDQIYN